MKEARTKRETTLRTETISVRMDPKLRYLAKVAAQKQRRPISSFVEWAVEKALSLVEIGSDGKTIADHANFLWDVDEPDRFVRLAFNFEELLNHEEQRIWKLIKDNRSYWLLDKDTSAGNLKPGTYQGILDAIGVLERGVPDIRKIREDWPRLLAAVRRQESLSPHRAMLAEAELSASHAAQGQGLQNAHAPASATTPRAEKNQPRKG